jgi:hypothetical protein
MDVATTTLIERIARVLAGTDHSANAEGVEPSASDSVDETWRAYLPQALAVLKTTREPSPGMAQAGDVAVWEAMVLAGLREADALVGNEGAYSS